MKVTREQAQENRERVLQSASRLFRERGFDGIGVADLMKDAGLTHGAFYGQFGSKEALMVEACTTAFEASATRWRGIVEDHPEDGLAVIASRYLTRRHRDDPGAGCCAASLSVDAARQGPAVRAAVGTGVDALVSVLEGVSPGRTRRQRRRAALATFASLVGAVVLSRAVEDEGLSDEILEAVGEHVKAVASGR